MLKKKRCKALTLLEMVIALSIISVLFAVVLPILTNAGNSWQSRHSSSETIQNGRIFTDYISNQLAKAVKIISVSDPDDSNGFIEFENDSGTVFRCEIGANNYVRFGPAETQSDLAGPVTTLKFKCYALDDLTTAVTDTDSIRLIKAEATFSNESKLGNDKAFTASAFIQTNGNTSAVCSIIASLDFDTTACKDPVLAKIDDNHFLCAYTGDKDDGWATVLIVNPGKKQITKGPSFEYADKKALTSVLSKIDATHYMCVYSDEGYKGSAIVLEVDPVSWAISSGPVYKFKSAKVNDPDLVRIDPTHFLCAYAGHGHSGMATILNVNNATWKITQGENITFDKKKGNEPALAKIDSTHYLCAYSGHHDNGRATVLQVDPNKWKISCSKSYKFNSLIAKTPDIAQIDLTNYLCSYSGQDNKGLATVLAVNTGNWSVYSGSPSIFNTEAAKTTALARIDSQRFLCVYERCFGHGTHDGWLNILSVDTDNLKTTANVPFEFEVDTAKDIDLMHIIDEYYLSVYSGPDDNGRAVILEIDPDASILP